MKGEFYGKFGVSESGARRWHTKEQVVGFTGAEGLNFAMVKPQRQESGTTGMQWEYYNRGGEGPQLTDDNLLNDVTALVAAVQGAKNLADLPDSVGDTVGESEKSAKIEVLFQFTIRTQSAAELEFVEDIWKERSGLVLADSDQTEHDALNRAVETAVGHAARVMPTLQFVGVTSTKTGGEPDHVENDEGPVRPEVPVSSTPVTVARQVVFGLSLSSDGSKTTATNADALVSHRSFQDALTEGMLDFLNKNFFASSGLTLNPTQIQGQQPEIVNWSPSASSFLETTMKAEESRQLRTQRQRAGTTISQDVDILFKFGLRLDADALANSTLEDNWEAGGGVGLSEEATRNLQTDVAAAIAQSEQVASTGFDVGITVQDTVTPENLELDIVWEEPVPNKIPRRVLSRELQFTIFFDSELAGSAKRVQEADFNFLDAALPVDQIEKLNQTMLSFRIALEDGVEGFLENNLHDTDGNPLIEQRTSALHVGTQVLKIYALPEVPSVPASVSFLQRTQWKTSSQQKKQKLFTREALHRGDAERLAELAEVAVFFTFNIEISAVAEEQAAVLEHSLTREWSEAHGLENAGTQTALESVLNETVAEIAIGEAVMEFVGVTSTKSIGEPVFPSLSTNTSTSTSTTAERQDAKNTTENNDLANGIETVLLARRLEFQLARRDGGSAQSAETIVTAPSFQRALTAGVLDFLNTNFFASAELQLNTTQIQGTTPKIVANPRDSESFLQKRSGKIFQHMDAEKQGRAASITADDVTVVFDFGIRVDADDLEQSTWDWDASSSAGLSAVAAHSLQTKIE
ncbi:unnamed protein product, partial [Amoebophrya sp. A120]|eukprot:GSA120T00026043001.1